MGGKNTPDFGDIAASQGQENDRVVRNQIYANRPNQYTPLGFTSWNPTVVRDPATGQNVTQWEQTTGLTPQLQDILNKQIAIQGGRTDIAGMLTGRMGGMFGQNVNFDNLTPMGYVPAQQLTAAEPDIGNPNAFRQQGADAAYNAAMNRIAPEFQEQRRAMEVRLRNQGLSPEDRAWQSQMEGIGQAENDARNQAIWGAQEAGRQESALNWGQQMGQQQNRFSQALNANQQNFGQALQSSQYANQLRQQQMAELMQQRGFNLNEINALLSGQQVGMPQMPSFSQATSAQPAPIYQGAVDSANIGAANNQALWGGIGSLAGAGIGAYGTYAGLQR